MNAGELDVATISLLGGHPALDFVNTIENRVGPAPDDTVRTPDDLHRWGLRLGLLTSAPAAEDPDDPGELDAARQMRSALIGILEAMVAGDVPTEHDRTTLARTVADAHAHGTLVAPVGAPLRWQWDTAAPATVRHTVATSALALLTSEAVSRIRRCDGPDCGWFFLDTSKNGSRRWCSMRGCGNRVKAMQRRG